MIKKIVKKLILFLQIPLLYFSYYFFFLFKTFIPKVKFVIGTEEIATKNINDIGKALNDSITVCLRKHPSYDLDYNFSISINNKFLRFFYLMFYSPILFGYLINKADVFFYVWSKGFLYDRNFDFKFLKSKKKKIVCLFVGNDIRSLKLKIAYMKNKNLDTGECYFIKASDDKYDEEKKELAFSADTYADLIFSYPVDNMSYIKSKQYPWRKPFDKKFFNLNHLKFPISKIKIVHAPTSMMFKGTPLVRAAIKKLQMEGYVFDYVELQNSKNQIVLEQLKTAHIVLNQFYSFIPGLFGIEAMASHCAVLMSADPNIDTDITKDRENAWLITRYWEIFDKLKYLLDNPEKIKFYADNGYKYTHKYHTHEVLGEYLDNILKENSII